MSNLQQTLQDRAEQLLTAEQHRDELDSTHPIVFAEQGPNRFSVMSLFFSDKDGVRILEDLDIGSVDVIYFNGEEEITLTEGALHDWAVEFYRNN